MSSSLLWEPANKGKSLSDDLKFLLRNSYCDPVKATLDCTDIPYLSGLRDASQGIIKKDLHRLIAMIKKYDQIKIWEGW